MNTKDTILKECKNRITQRHVHLDWDALSEHSRNKYHDLVCKEYAEILTEKYRSLILEQSELINKLNNLLVKITSVPLKVAVTEQVRSIINLD